MQPIDSTSLWPAWARWPFRTGASARDPCENGDVRRYGLKPIREMPFIGLFEDLRDVKKFEASGMTSARGKLWVVFDNLHSLGRIDEHFQFRDPGNTLLGHTGEDSQFEGLSYDEKTGHFYVIEEVELAVDERTNTYKVIERCPVHFKITHENKGFEGIHYFRDPKDPSRELLLGLCEGNYCRGGKKGRDPGNGRIVVSQFWKNSSGCAWDVVKIVDIPPSANFMDYSGIDFRGDRVAITSQEDSAVWVGRFDFHELDFVDTDKAQVYHFPRDNHCDMIYCNVEGIAWLDDMRFIVSSDKAKKTQPYRCTVHDQSIGIFALP
ncbi:hypothetical protein MNEG_2696 [Monoraphidium neglectum]|uniref:Uncharacterized protein n=1 Tax=Monoraphidium neglectum TaxID=145388 RepID=A0A0D2NKD9_9CHLO|nr:hypothetical protein MNEG_2696 [Monoraphidium neglectum]KIZ05261.1 hypothetical protein MNEG_2696 [Monoraphidium neglectum]|eukprot:XP_013904280.1 hypothetical protein MNEG_2696 [Monoraphidium neglectum]